MKCDETSYDPNMCNLILNSCENIILEGGVLSFNHTKVLKENICSTRKFYNYFNSREEIVICILLRRTITYEIEKFLEDHEELPAIAKLYIPTLITLEVARIDPVYQKVALMATNIGVWQVAHEDKQERLAIAEKRYIETIRKVASSAIASNELEANCIDEITEDFYLYNMGMLLSAGSIISKRNQEFAINENNARSLIALTNQYRQNQNIKPALIMRLYEKVRKYLDGERKISCERCIYFRK